MIHNENYITLRGHNVKGLLRDELRWPKCMSSNATA